MKRIGITGARGLLGTHLHAYLKGQPDTEVVAGGREVFGTAETLQTFVRGCDAIIHLAGMNRGEDADIASTNVLLCEQLIAALTAERARPHLLFSSSTHIERDSAYGVSKRHATSVLRAWAERTGAPFTNLILPGVFGEGGKPFYNSVVSTFCFQVANGESPSVNADAVVEQIHAQEVARQLHHLILEGTTGDVRVTGEQLTVGDLLARLQQFHSLYAAHIIPDVRQDFDRDLFNTYRSYLYPQRYPVALTLHTDARGSLFEAIKSPNGGQAFLSTTHPGITRGNHYHTRKIERFLVTGGEAEIKLRHVTRAEVQTFRVRGDTPVYIDIPTLHTHNITNVGSGVLTTLFWTHELFDPQHPDTYPELVEPA
ncbi:NAD-dependent epimerase/dehydratase family protein [Deinococcus maricopensis]|uniref:NAD-dependent epimerase/dehydratase n=1 Tax=Deinococcus maricopensis (strain DSM 21211 / LMG 22137 / NRRL B-23946 / LB-34) TaxID=709986 RepID=E8UC07_DEIML|nr:NAD-dependent epimerase/dehydratase family protein [Deinococcus maricopensis]ADV68596.1 NAD-dependent epimerase/dehydratase [Deinococcus maricopensis DSM 21211]